MRDSTLSSMSLLSWTLQIWHDHRRGVRQSGHLAAIVYCMEHHREWWRDWDLATGSDKDASMTTRLVHIHNDAVIKGQLDRGDPPEIMTLFNSLREKCYSEFDSIHTLALALMEENDYVREHDGAFNRDRYVERANRVVLEIQSRNLVRI